MTPDCDSSDETFDVAYLVLSGTSTAARGPELLRALVALGFASIIAIPTPNASRVVASRELADVSGIQVVESYFDSGDSPATAAWGRAVCAVQL